MRRNAITRRVLLAAAALLTVSAVTLDAARSQAHAQTATADVLVVGDSLCNQARNTGGIVGMLHDTGLRVEYACSGGQPLTYGTHYLRSRPAAPPILVVALGTNQSDSPGAFAAEASELLDVARSRGVRTVRWLTNAVRTPLAIPLEVHIPEQNDVVAGLGYQYDVTVEDWAKVLGAEPWLWAEDGIHYTATGSVRYARFLADAVLAGRAELYAQQVRNLYLATFGREPEPEGQRYWTLRLWWGASLEDIADHFAVSDEFRARYSDAPPQVFVDVVYVNVLRRDPDPEGREYWTERLQGGMRRGTLLVNFSESPEFIRAPWVIGRQ